MLKRSVLALSFVLLVLAGCQTQPKSPLEPVEYDASQDVYVVFHGEHFDDATKFLPAKLIGELAFDLQEGTHDNITDVSGAEVDHYYIWLCLADACIPVDPFTFSK